MNKFFVAVEDFLENGADNLKEELVLQYCRV